MKLLTFERKDKTRGIGVLLTGDAALDLQAASVLHHGAARAHFSSMLDLLDGGDAAMDDARLLAAAGARGLEGAHQRLNDVTILAPVPVPRSIRDCMAFEAHVVTATRNVARGIFPPVAWLDAAVAGLTGHAFLAPPRAWKKQPIYYKSNVHSVVGTGHDIQWPSFSKRLDYELEFGVFVGRRGVNIAPQDAMKHVAGFTIFNDVSARDMQLFEMGGRLGPAKGKDFDTGNVMGPYLVTPDEVGDPYALTMLARVNGQQWSAGNSSTMKWRFEELLAHISRDETLHPGEFVGSGTVGGGCGLELDRWIQPGDEVELEVQNLGVLKNRVVGPLR